MAEDIFGGYYEEDDNNQTTTDNDIFGGYFSNAPKPEPTVPKPVQQAVDALPQAPIEEPTFEQPKKKLSFGDKFGGFAQSFATGFGTGTGAIIDQILHLGSKNVQRKEKWLDKGIEFAEETLGVKSKTLDKLQDFNYADRLEKFRTKLKRDVAGGAEISTETNPYAETFGGKTAGVIGGMVPQVLAALTGAPAITLALSEATMNAEQSYDENIKKGLTHEQAMTRALPQFGADLTVTYLTNKFGLMSKLGGKKNLFNFGKGQAGRITSGITEYLKDAGLEVGQEVIQNGLQNLATDKPFTQGMGETAKLTIIPALLFGAGGVTVNIKDPVDVKDKTTQLIDTVNDKLANDEPLDEQETLTYALTNGQNPFTEEQADITPEGIDEIASQFVPAEKEEVSVMKLADDFNNELISTEEVATELKKIYPNKNPVDIENKINVLVDIKETGGSTLEAIQNIVETAPEYTPKPPTKKPVEPKEKKPSKIAKSIEAKAIEAKLTKGFSEVAGFTPITIKDQAERAEKLINEDIEKVRAILRGEEEIPSGLKGIALTNAVEEYLKSNPNEDIAYELANSPLISESSEAAQIMRLTAEREQDSATNQLRLLKEAREKQAKKVSRAKKSDVAKIFKKEAEKNNLTKEELDWNGFLAEIKC